MVAKLVFITKFLKQLLEFEIYDFQFNSWRVLDATPGWDTDFDQSGASR